MDTDHNGFVSLDEFNEGQDLVIPVLPHSFQKDSFILSYDDFITLAPMSYQLSHTFIWSKDEGFKAINPNNGMQQLVAHADGVSDRRAKYLKAFLQGQTMQKIFETEGHSDKVLKQLNARLKQLEKEWDKFYKDASHSNDRSDMIKEILKICHKSIWQRLNTNPKDFLKSLSSKNLKALHFAALLSGFYHKKKLRHADNSLASDIFKNIKDCHSITALSIHLIKRSGIDGFKIQVLPGHITLALPLDNAPGKTVYFDGGKQFFPPGFFDWPENPYVSLKKGRAPLLPLWQIFSTTMLKAAHKHFKNNDFDQAKKLLKDALKLSPEFSTALYNLGHVYFAQKRYDDAINAIKRAIKLNPDTACFYFLLAKCYLALEKTDTAIKMLKLSLTLKRDCHLTHNILGRAFAKKSNHNQAVYHFNEALKYKPTYFYARKNLAKSLWHLKEYQNSMAEFVDAFLTAVWDKVIQKK